MEPPVSLDADDVRNEKVKVFEALRPFGPEDLSHRLILGQYSGYPQEDKVSEDSTTETLVATKIFIDNDRCKANRYRLHPQSIRTHQFVYQLGAPE